MTPWRREVWRGGRTAAAVALGLVATVAIPPVARAAPAPAEVRAEVPPRSEALLLLRVLAYDRQVAHRTPGGVVVLVVARQGDRASEVRAARVAAAFEEVAREVVIAGLPVRTEVLAVRDAAAVSARLDAARAALVYADEALAPAAAELARICRRRGALSAGATRAMVSAGLSVAIVARGGRPGVLVNLVAARLEGADLDSGLLAVSEVVRE